MQYEDIHINTKRCIYRMDFYPLKRNLQKSASLSHANPLEYRRAASKARRLIDQAEKWMQI
jgi:hypothetical protein